jgi:hypothetical protein
MSIVLLRNGDCYDTIRLPEFSVEACAAWLDVVPSKKQDIDDLNDNEQSASVLLCEALDTIIVELKDVNGKAKTFTGKMSEFVINDLVTYNDIVVPIY